MPLERGTKNYYSIIQGDERDMFKVNRRNKYVILSIFLSVLLLVSMLISFVSADDITSLAPGKTPNASPQLVGDGTKKVLDLAKEEAWNKTFYTSDLRLIPDEKMIAGVLSMVPEGMELLAQEGGVSLYFNPKDTTFAVKDDQSGDVWTSAPQDSELDKVAKGDNLNRLSALVMVEYYSESGSLQTFDSYNHSVALGNYSYEKKENGVEITYQIGRKKTVTSSDVPNIISKERFESFLNKMDKSKSADTKNRYRLYSLDNARTEEAREKMIKEYPTVVKGDIYVLKNKSDTLLYMIRDNLAEVGYTTDDLLQDNNEHNIQAEIQEEQIFQVVLSIGLENEKLVAKVDGSKLTSPSKTPIHTLHILPFFGAANLASRGYMLVPDGSGGLVYLNSFSSSTQNLVLPLYGRDDALRQSTSDVGQEMVSLPVYGMKNGDSGFLAIIERGDGVGNVNCAIPGMQNSYNCIWPSFTLNPHDSFEALQTGNLGGGVLTTLYPDKKYDTDLVVSYTLLKGETASYAGMATTYRKHLQKNNLFTSEILTTQTLPFIVETIGAVDMKAAALGIIQYDKIVPLTTFEQTETILSKLKYAGVDNIQLRLCGWMNGGMSQTPANNIKVLKVLGGAKGLKTMLQAAEEAQVTVYADVKLQTIRNPNLFYSKKKNAVRYLGNVYASLYQYDIPSGNILKGTQEYLLSPVRLPSLAAEVSQKLKDLGIHAISVDSLGSRLYSDFNIDQFSTRDDSIVYTKEALGILAEQNDILVDGANAYALSNASLLVNIPIGGSGYRRINEEVPFLQMVLHGYVPYAGTPQNHTDDPQLYNLKCIEYGAAPYYQWSYEPASATRRTNYNSFYALGYESTFETAVEDYVKRNEKTGMLSGKTITNHFKLDDQVYATVYEGGECVVVNYNQYDVVIQDTTVAAYGWAVMEGEALS